MAERISRESSTIVRFTDLTPPEKFIVLMRATAAQDFYTDRELQRYKGKEGWWISLKGGRRVFVEARHVIRGDVDQDFASDVMDSFKTFDPKFISRTTYVSLAPAQQDGWWIFRSDSGLLGTYSFDTKHITIYDDDHYRTGGNYTVGGTVAHELAHSHFCRNGMSFANPDRPANERKLVDNWISSVYKENAVASPYAWVSFNRDVSLGHAENFSEFGKQRYEAQEYGGRYAKKWDEQKRNYPKSTSSFLALWKFYGGD